MCIRDRASIGAVLFHLPMLSLAVSAMVILLMSGMILWQTSDIIHGGETNYIMATVTLYILSLIHIWPTPRCPAMPHATRQARF